MKVLSPDETFVAAADRMMAAIQARGVPFPMALAPFPSVILVCYMGALAASLRLSAAGDPSVAKFGFAFVAIFSFSAGLSAVIGFRETRRFVADARGWSAATAMRYRASAVLLRETRAAQRYGLVLGTVATGTALLGVAAEGGPADGRPIVGAMLGLTLAVGVRALAGYVACAMPRDPEPMSRPAREAPRPAAG